MRTQTVPEIAQALAAGVHALAGFAATAADASIVIVRDTGAAFTVSAAVVAEAEGTVVQITPISVVRATSGAGRPPTSIAPTGIPRVGPCPKRN